MPLQSGWAKTLQSLSGKSKLTEENIQETLREVRMALLEADVALPVVKQFIDQVRQRAVGQEVSSSLSPGQAFVKIVNDELVRVMGEESHSLNFNVQPPAIILLAGLQGVGKTTTAAKLALWLKNREKKSVMLASTDVYRPAAIDQLRRWPVRPRSISSTAIRRRSPRTLQRMRSRPHRNEFADVLIIDTAGRLAIDQDMMNEVRSLHETVSPAETLFVVDALTGQDAATTAQTFNEVLPLTGVVLTKADGDSRGGAALSVRVITGKPIKFMAMGEGIDALEAFYPDRIASRILGMGDMLSLIEEAEQKIDKKKADRLAKKMKKGKRFDLEDFRDQIHQMNSMGGIGSMMEKLPGMGQMAKAAEEQMASNPFGQMEAIINSMTPNERRYPDSINGSRKRRIARGSGTEIQDINRLLKQHKQMQKMMKKMNKKGAMANMMRGMNANMQQPPGGRFR
ncbi:MAG: signal recognition particle protein [Gammaproteobacteria bacterium]|nr:signal recognition particle protein [Gammaproteobacteria bacterium]